LLTWYERGGERKPLGYCAKGGKRGVEMEKKKEGRDQLCQSRISISAYPTERDGERGS